MEDSSEKRKGFVCDVCSLKFLSSTELFDHSFTWEHRVKQDSKSSSVGSTSNTTTTVSSHAKPDPIQPTSISKPPPVSAKHHRRPHHHHRHNPTPHQHPELLPPNQHPPSFHYQEGAPPKSYGSHESSGDLKFGEQFCGYPSRSMFNPNSRTQPLLSSRNPNQQFHHPSFDNPYSPMDYNSPHPSVYIEPSADRVPLFPESAVPITGINQDRNTSETSFAEDFSVNNFQPQHQTNEPIPLFPGTKKDKNLGGDGNRYKGPVSSEQRHSPHNQSRTISLPAPGVHRFKGNSKYTWHNPNIVKSQSSAPSNGGKTCGSLDSSNKSHDTERKSCDSLRGPNVSGSSKDKNERKQESTESTKKSHDHSKTSHDKKIKPDVHKWALHDPSKKKATSHRRRSHDNTRITNPQSSKELHDPSGPSSLQRGRTTSNKFDSSQKMNRFPSNTMKHKHPRKELVVPTSPTFLPPLKPQLFRKIHPKSTTMAIPQPKIPLNVEFIPLGEADSSVLGEDKDQLSSRTEKNSSSPTAPDDGGTSSVCRPTSLPPLKEWEEFSDKNSPYDMDLVSPISSTSLNDTSEDSYYTALDTSIHSDGVSNVCIHKPTSEEDSGANTKESISIKTGSTISDHPSMTIQTLSAVSTTCTVSQCTATKIRSSTCLSVDPIPSPNLCTNSSHTDPEMSRSGLVQDVMLVGVGKQTIPGISSRKNSVQNKTGKGRDSYLTPNSSNSISPMSLKKIKTLVQTQNKSPTAMKNSPCKKKKRTRKRKQPLPKSPSSGRSSPRSTKKSSAQRKGSGDLSQIKSSLLETLTTVVVNSITSNVNAQVEERLPDIPLVGVDSDMFPIVNPRTGSLPIPSVYNEISRPSTTETIRARHGIVTESASLRTNSATKGSEILYTGRFMPSPACTSTASISSLPFVSLDADTAQQSAQAMMQFSMHSSTPTTLSNFSSDQPIFSSSPVQSNSKQPRTSYKGQGLFSKPRPVVARLLSPESILQLARLPQRLPTTSLPVPPAPKHPTKTAPSQAVTQGTENKSNRVASESSGSDLRLMKDDNASPGTSTAGTEVDLANSVAVSSNVDVVKKPSTVVLQQEDVRRTSLDNLKSRKEKVSSQKEKLADLQTVTKKEEVAGSVGYTAVEHQSTSGTGLQLTVATRPKVSVKEEPIEFDAPSSVTSIVTTTDVDSCERRRVCLWSSCRNSVHSGRLCLKHLEFSDKIRAQILGEQSPLTPPTCPPPSHLPHPSLPPHTSQSVTTLFSSVSQPVLFGDIRHVGGPNLISNFDELRTTSSGKALKEGLPPSAAGTSLGLPPSAAGTSLGLPPSASIKDSATQGLPPSIPIKESSKQGFTKANASNKQGLPQRTTIHNQDLAHTKQKTRDENQEHHVPCHPANSKRVLPPTGQRSKEGLPPPKQTTITIEPNTRKRSAVDEQEVSSPNKHRATKEVVLPPKKKHKPDVLHIASNKSPCEPSAGGDSSEGETPVVESSLLSPAFVNEINVLNQEERDIQLKLFEVQSTLNDLLPTEEGKSKECESLRHERESEQRICDQLKTKLQGVFSKKQEVLCGSISTQSMEMMKKFNEEEREFQHDLIRAMTCLTEKDKRLSELDHELRALNAKKVELTTRKQDLTQTYQQILKKKQDLIFQPSQFLLNRPSCPSVQSDVTESTGPSSSSPSADTFSVTVVPIDDVLHSETSSKTAQSAITSTPTTEHISIVNSTSDARTSTVDNCPEVVKATAVSASSLTISGRSTAVPVSPQPLQPVRQGTTTSVHSLSHPRAESAVVKINDSEKTSVEREKVSQSRCLPLGKQVDVSVNQPGKLTKETDQSEAEKQDQSKMKQHSVKTKEPDRSQPGVSFGTASTSNKKATKEIKNVNSSKDISSKAQKRSRSKSTSSDTETKSKCLCLPQFTALPEGHSAQPSVKRVKTSKECSPLQLKSTRNRNIDKTKTCGTKLNFSEHLTSPSDPGSCSSSSSAITTSERSVQKQDGESNSNHNTNSNAHSTFNQPDISTENNDTDRDRLLCSESSSTVGGVIAADSIPGKGGNKPRGNQQMTLPSFQPHTKSVLCLKACDKYLFSSSSDSSVHVYDIDTGRLVMNLPSYHKKAANSLAVYKREDDLYFLSGSSDKCIHMHSVKRRKKVATFEIGKQIMSIDVSGDLLFAGLKTGAVLVINIDMNVKDKKGLGQSVCHDCTISYLCVDKHYLFTGSFDNTVAVWDMSESIANGLKKSPFKRIQSIPFPNTPLCIKVHDGCLFVACGDSNVYIYDMKDWTQLHLLPHSGAATGLEIVGNVLVTSSFDKYIRCFDVKTLKLLQLYAGYQDKIFCVCVSGAKIFAGMGDGSIKGVTMDLTAFYVCKWKDCGSRFGVLEHLTDYHLKDHINPKMKLSTSCEWDSCSRVLNPSDLLNHLKSHCQDLQ